MDAENEHPEWVAPWWVPLVCFLGLLACAGAACFIWLLGTVLSGPLGPAN